MTENVKQYLKLHKIADSIWYTNEQKDYFEKRNTAVEIANAKWNELDNDEKQYIQNIPRFGNIGQKRIDFSKIETT